MVIDSSFSATADLESDLMELWVKFLKKPDLTVDDDFFESGGDSLLATELFFEIEQLVQKPIPPSILFETGTVRQVAERLAGELTPKQAVKIGDGKGRWFHFFHGDFNNGGISVRQLAKMLGVDRPILALAPHGMDGGPLPTSIEEMASQRVTSILETQPEGPYLIGGHCNGALVAFEAAQKLLKAGHEVDLVVMVDPVNVYLWPLVRPVLRTWHSVWRFRHDGATDGSQFFDVAWLKLAKFESDFRTGRTTERWKKRWLKQWNRFRRWLGVGPRKTKSAGKEKSPDKAAKRRQQLSSQDPTRSERMRAYARVMSTYHPSRLDAPVFYLALGYSGRRWRRISPDMELIDRPTHHVPTTSDWDLVRSRLDALDLPVAENPRDASKSFRS